MKKAVWAAVLVALLMPAHAQETFNDLLQTDIRSQKVGIVGRNMNISPVERQEFWPIFERYNSESNELYLARVQVLVDLARNQAGYKDNEIREKMKQFIDLQEQEVKLNRKYFDEVENALSTRKAARFIQIINQYNYLQDLQLAMRIPMVQ